MAIINISGAGKRYRIFYEKSSLVKSFFAWTKGKRIYEDLWALKDISFAVEKGETVGMVGRNGSGKTTILKLLAGVTRPESGSVSTNGRVSALLELGTGFQEELTGRENIYLSGYILGMGKKEINKKFDKIVDFADIGKFIDSPMRTYSTGMWMRLGFALAINANFEILLIDEILAVGDAYFQKKCFEKFNELKQNGITILFVSHNLSKVKEICNRTIWLDNGIMKLYDSTEKVISAYTSDLNSMLTAEAEALSAHGILKKRWGSKAIEIKNVFLNGGNGNVFITGRPWEAVIEYFSNNEAANPVFGVGVHRKDGIHITGPNTKAYNYRIDHVKGKGLVKFRIDNMPFLEGEYYLSASIYDDSIEHPFDHQENICEFRVEKNKKEERYGFIKPEGRWSHVPGEE